MLDTLKTTLQLNNPGLLLAAASLAESLQADGVVIDKIYHPYVQPGEKEIEGRAIWQNRQPGRPDDLQLYRLGYGQSVGDTWFLELYALGKNSRITSYNVCYTKLLRAEPGLCDAETADRTSVCRPSGTKPASV